MSEYLLCNNFLFFYQGLGIIFLIVSFFNIYFMFGFYKYQIGIFKEIVRFLGKYFQYFNILSFGFGKIKEII